MLIQEDFFHWVWFGVEHLKNGKRIWAAVNSGDKHTLMSWLLFQGQFPSCFPWTCCAAVLLDGNSTGWKQFPLAPFHGLWQIFPINASRELLPGSQSSVCVGIPGDGSFPISASNSLGLTFPRKHRAVPSLLWSCTSKSAMPGELDCLME